MTDTNERLEQTALEAKKPKKVWPWIIVVSLIVIVGFAIWGIVELVQHKKKNKYIINHLDKKESSESDDICLSLQSSSFPGKEANSFSLRDEPKDELREDNVYIKTEVMYGTEYPNSYLDIYYPGALEENRPTYIYIHGGGFIFGDKNGGDPISPNADLFMYMFDYIHKIGYNLISVNYCLSPQYRYPIQIIQCLKSLEYLNKHAS